MDTSFGGKSGSSLWEAVDDRRGFEEPFNGLKSVITLFSAVNEIIDYYLLLTIK